MAYRSLEKLFYADGSSERFATNKLLAEERLESEYAFRTGIMTPVGELFLATPHELLVLNERVLRLERKVSKALEQLPPVARGALVRSLVVDEVVSTNDLEGVHSTRRQIGDVLASIDSGDEKGTVRTRRFRELAKLYLGLSDPHRIFPSDPSGIRAIYDQVMSGEDLGDNAPDGELFRKGEVGVYASNGKLLHSGVAPEAAIIEALEKMLDLVGSEDVPEIYSAIISHYLFEYIHPFYDGNGRTGRYLLALFLSRPLSTLTSLSLSRVIAEHRDAYYREFRTAESKLNHGELTFFVMNILGDIQVAQNQLVDSLEKKRSDLSDMRGRVDALGNDRGLSEREVGVLYMLGQLELFAAFPEATLAELAEYSGVGPQQTRKYMRALEELGLVEVVKRRPLSFKLSDIGRAALGLAGLDNSL